MRGFLLLGLLSVVAVGICAVGQGQEAQKCYLTEIKNKCGTDQVLSWVMCGDPPAQCNLEEEVYDLLRECKPAPAGLSGFRTVWCQKHTIHRECDAGACVYRGSDVENVVLGTEATGEACPHETT